MARMMLIDGNNIGFANQTANRLTIGDREVQAIFGFFKALRKLVCDYPGYRPVVLWDGRAQWRFDLYPGYKGNRKNPKMAAVKESYEAQRPDIQRGLRSLGVTQMTNFGAEADDLAGDLVSKCASRGHQVLLVSGDKDWIQLVSPTVTWYDPIRDRHCNPKNLAELTGFATTEQFIQGKALVGDSSDNIKGVGGIGEKGAQDFLMTYGSVERFFELADSGELWKVHDKVSKVHDRFAKNEVPPKYDTPMRDAFFRNLRLMSLQNPVLDRQQSNTDHGELNLQDFRELCEELAFMSFLGDFPGWVRPFADLRGVDGKAA